MVALSMLAVAGALAAGAPARPDRGSETLQAGAERFAAHPIAVDPRLSGRNCPGGYRYRWSDTAARAVEAVCNARAERLVLPLAPQAREGRAELRRGDPVQAEVAGRGFRVTVGAIAAGPERNGALLLRNSRSGSAFRGQLGADGRLYVAAAADAE